LAFPHRPRFDLGTVEKHLDDDLKAKAAELKLALDAITKEAETLVGRSRLREGPRPSFAARISASSRRASSMDSARHELKHAGG
jgi:hypothetical protein